MQMQTQTGSLTVIARLGEAINRHDLDALAACFAPDYASEFPTHPDRAFRGQDQMRKNWVQIFGAVPNITATLLRSVSEGDTAWAEWEWRGTRVDGAPFAMCGVTVVGVENDRITWARMYMEPVEMSGAGSDAAVRRNQREWKST
jgi:ketosteroid isomerase-like protein